ncbi:MBL fold metallo-hydrolase [uncultured Bacteroides sp.]|uniref:ComEC/Rec2 family competence protein n=1 Tax=uncultured Bacteroides sp. TaxID=162156 RepID=UPI002AAACBA4|nr:MBL fold metallo-hydrolase [uncultured Bacteroides sp.]
MPITLKFLQAGHGDAFIFECEKDGDSFVMVVDSGPRISQCKIVPIIKGLSKIDLLVLSHYDEDHISGYLEYFKNYQEDALKIREYWCNCASQIEVEQRTIISAYSNAKTFADYLRQISKEFRDTKWIELIKAGHQYNNEFVDIEVVAPSNTALTINRNKYITSEYPAITCDRVNDDLDVSLKDLAKRPTPYTSQVINNASIAFILRTEGKSYLMLGDVMPDDVVNYLVSKGYSEDCPLEVDFVKVSHHGSRYNISNNLLDIIKCNNYIISTNGGRASAIHPDRETIAKLLYHPQRSMQEIVHLYFNYKLNELQKHRAILFNDGEIEEAKCEVHEEEFIL